MLARIYAATGRYGEAADALMELAAGDLNSDFAQGARLLRSGPAKSRPAGKVPNLGTLNQPLYIYLGAPDRALERFERMADVGYFTGSGGYIWHPSYAPIRRTEKFKAVMRKLGLMEYWRANGWPEFCHPTTGDDFACV